MATKLTRYTQETNIASTDIILNDLNSPYSFQEWLERNTGILPDKEQLQYENYVKRWYKNKEEEVPTKQTVKEDYIQLLKQLTLAFKSEADALWTTDINFDDPNEIEQVIPFYASKLKEIAIYLINKREAVRRAKLKYNMTGTYPALERIFHEYLLKAFTKRQFPGNEYITTITDVSVLNVIPELSAVRSGFQIFVEELYDDASYFDRDPTLPVSSYFTFDANVSTYLDSLNIAPSDYEWLYSTGVSNLCADNPLLWSVDSVLNQYKNGTPLSAVELYDSDVLNDYNRIKLAQKYIGEQQYILSGGYWIPWKDGVSFNLVKGNNWFYWLTGENVFENKTDTIIDSVYLNSTNLIESSATAGIDATSSDIIYLTRDNVLSGAWLRLVDKSTFSAIMSARLNKGKNVFAFPYPGYGLSGEDLVWTGKTFDNFDQTFFYLDRENQEAVYNAYWNSLVSSVSTFNPVYINDTALVESGAQASEKFSDADYIVTRPTFRDATQDYVYTDDKTYAWLYKMMKTDLPIKAGDNNLYWPFERYSTTISMFASSNQCSPSNLSGIDLQNFVGAVAGSDPDTADKIFKKISPNSSTYMEGAWLKGNALPQPTSITNSNILSGCYQPNVALKILGGAYGSFIWTDSTAFASSVFNNVKHQNDCEYLKDSQFSLFKEKPSQEKDLNYNQWTDCSCRAILYSPLGHPGESFDDFDGMTDFIVAVTSPISSFSFKDWRGIDGNSYNSSGEFGWFKLDKQYSVEPDVGWGSGTWVTNTGAPFMLSAGVMYLYYRSDMRRDNPNSTVPYLVTKYKNTNTQNQWNKLYFDKTGNKWKDANVISDMIIKSGDILKYSHRDTYSFTLTSITGVQSCSYQYDILNSISNVTSSFQNQLSAAFAAATTISAAKVDYYTYTNNAINFMLNVPLSGWNYTNSVYDGVSLGARPIWVDASDEDDDYTKQKRIDVWSGAPILVDDYNFVTQPPYSNMVFNGNTYVEFNKRNTGTIIWKQPVNGTAIEQDKKWCKLLINTNGISNLSATLFNNINDLIVTATNVQSDIVLDVVQDKPLLINYYARNGFTWTQEISNSSLGMPPTGGVWVDIKNGTLITPNAPYAHLSNRHYPTYASVPSVGDLYSTKDSGGYFIPRLLGVSTAVSKNRENVLDTTKINNDQTKRGITAIYRDLNTYASDRGLSNNDQIEPVSKLSTDSSWMKASTIEGKKAGMIVHAKPHQEFMPYQSKYECVGLNDSGIFRQDKDVFDPWFGDLDITWENETDWPSNQRKQYDIKGWYESQDRGNQQVYQWKTDIFGNQYAVLKSNLDSFSIYDKKHTCGGTIWTRNAYNAIEPADISLSGVFVHAPSNIDIASMSNETSAVLDIDIWFDTLMIYTSSVLFFFHLNFDFDTGIISSTSDEMNYIVTDNSKFGGTWFFEDNKRVTICTLLSCGNQVRPILRSLDLETNQINYLFDKETSYTNMSSFALTGYDHPIFTYDGITKTYNISYIGYNQIKAGMYLTTINIRDYGEYHDIVTSKTIVPEA